MAAPIADIIAGAISGTADLASSIYNIFADVRNYDYQKATQQQIFEREDTAVQRRMADLEAAGLNPQLAAGSGAGAGSIVSTRAPQWQGNALGNALDMASHIEQLRQQKKQTQLLDQQIQIANQEKWSKIFQNQLDEALTDYWLGDKNSDYHYAFSDFSQSRYFDVLNWQMQNNKNSADMLQKQNDWYTTNQVMNFVGNALGDISDIAGSFNKATGGLKYLKGNIRK